MRTIPAYLEAPYLEIVHAEVIDVFEYANGKFGLILDRTCFYPIGGGQPTDQGTLTSKDSSEVYKVVEVVIKDGEIVHFIDSDNPPKVGEQVLGEINWDRRLKNMATHTAGHIIDFGLQKLGYVPTQITPLKASHGSKPEIVYQGKLDASIEEIQTKVDEMIKSGLEFNWNLMELAELEKIATYLQPGLPSNKPLRALTLEGHGTVADGGTIMKKTSEVEFIEITSIEDDGENTIIKYSCAPKVEKKEVKSESNAMPMEAKTEEGKKVINRIQEILDKAESDLSNANDIEEIRVKYLGRKSEFNQIMKSIRDIPGEDRGIVGKTANETKNKIVELIENSQVGSSDDEGIDVTAPGTKIEPGSLHITVTQAIREIADIFKRMGFYRVRYPEVDWDYYAFSALNFPDDHPARDDWETFFIDKENVNNELGKRLLTPHTSSGQVREMETGRMPIRMINISRCSRRQLDASHTMQFFQFEGMMIDRDVTIANLKGILDYFVKEFFGPDREVRIRPYNFKFTEPSFEVDVSVPEGLNIGKEGWLEIGGCGMIHPNVLRAGGIDPDVYSGWAFGWGVERNKAMQKGVNMDDIRVLYQNDIRFLKQF